MISAQGQIFIVKNFKNNANSNKENHDIAPVLTVSLRRQDRSRHVMTAGLLLSGDLFNV